MSLGDNSGPDAHYRRLGVAPTASREEIVRAYRRLAELAHPDTNPNDPDAAHRFREVTEAYDVLSSPERRAHYDRIRRPPTGSSPRPEMLTRLRSRGKSPIPTWTAAPGTAPVVLEARPVPSGSVPLVAGPVRVQPPAAPRPQPAAPPADSRTGELSWLCCYLLLRGW
jgi:hypothetical protein